MIVKVTEDNFQDMEKGNVKKISCFHKKTQRIENDKVSRYFKVSAWGGGKETRKVMSRNECENQILEKSNIGKMGKNLAGSFK